MVSGHLLFDKEVLNSKITGIFRSPVPVLNQNFINFLIMNITKMKQGGIITSGTESRSPQSSSMESPQEYFGLITKFGNNTNLKSTGMMENSPPFSPLVPDGTVKQAPPGGGLEDTSTLLKMLMRKQNNSSISSQEVITSFYLQIISTLFVQKIAVILCIMRLCQYTCDHKKRY